MRFYFNIRDGAHVTRDEEGMYLPDIEAARDEARSGARQLLAAEYAATQTVDERAIEITDPRGRVIETVLLSSVLH